MCLSKHLSDPGVRPHRRQRSLTADFTAESCCRLVWLEEEAVEKDMRIKIMNEHSNEHCRGGGGIGRSRATVEQEIFSSVIFAFSFVIKFGENVFLRFLLLMYRQSIKQRNICVFNFCDRLKIPENAKVSCFTVRYGSTVNRC